jgi:N-acetylmuramoyl-L-alanine amidase
MNKWQKKIWQSLLWMLILPGLACASNNAKLTGIQFATVNNASRITLSLSQSTVSHVFTLSNPERLVVDFENTRLNTPTKNMNFSAAGISSVRSGHPISTTLRIVMDLASPVHFKVLSEPRDREVVIDVRSPVRAQRVVQSAPKVASNKPFFKPFATAMPSSTFSSNSSKPVAHPIVIVIDAGHGGKDSGAVGPLGTKEKNVTLRVARALAELINQHTRMRAVLTRDGDYFVPLRGRLKLARKGNADLFVALHADSYFNDQASGASVYTLSQHGATTEAARWLAQRENYSELGGVDLSELGDQSYLLRSVLIDLAQTATTTDSQHLGGFMLSSMKRLTRLHYAHVEQAPFMVLKSPDIPSILVEMGFISNEDEELHLRDQAYQNKMAQVLFDGIRLYLKKYPITGA